MPELTRKLRPDPLRRLHLDKQALEGEVVPRTSLPEADAATLIRADHAWRTVQGMLRITYGRGRMDRLAQSTASALLRAAAEAGLPAVDVAALRATLDAIALQVRACFNRHVGEIVS